MTGRVTRTDGSAILYEDGLLVDPPESRLFDAETRGSMPPTAALAGGRGIARVIRHGHQEWVLRHYHRGGAIRHLLVDRFMWLGEENTRCFREWRLLDTLVRLGLPVPRPVAARYRREGAFYRQDLITVRIPNAESFAQRLGRQGASPDVWASVGQCIARFHAAGVWHADLNAHNVQIDAADRVYLLDFDRGRIRRDHAAWPRRNLQRLERSLRKIGDRSEIAFSPREWDWLLAGYRDPSRS